MKNNKGFSLIEILIAIGLLGALSAWMMQIFTQQTKNEKTTATNMDIDAIGLEIRNILADGLSCEKTFKGIKADTPSAATEIQKVLADGTAQKRFNANVKKIGNTNLLISSFDLKTDGTYFVPKDQTVGETVLYINYDRGKLVQGGKFKSFKIPLSISVDDSGNIVECHALASTTNLASLCNALGRSINVAGKKCSAPTIYVKGDTPVHLKQYERCQGGSGTGEHELDRWTAEGTGTIRLTWVGMANDTMVNWKVYKNSETISSTSGGGFITEVKTADLQVKKGDVLKHTVSLTGGIDGDCISGGSFTVGLDLLNM